MKRKDYLKPTMTIAELQHRTRLLVGSIQARRVSGERQSYGEATTDTWGDESE